MGNGLASENLKSDGSRFFASIGRSKIT